MRRAGEAVFGYGTRRIAPSSKQQTNATRAVNAYNAMQKYFYVQDGTSLYHEMYPWNDAIKYAYLWEFSRALIGTTCLAGVPSALLGRTNYQSAVQDRLKALGQYWDGGASIPAYASYVLSQGGGDNYYDDNAWLALALVQQFPDGPEHVAGPHKTGLLVCDLRLGPRRDRSRCGRRLLGSAKYWCWSVEPRSRSGEQWRTRRGGIPSA